MKKIGIVGGVGWQSTVEYYSQLCRRSEQRHAALGLPGMPAMPEIYIESLDLAKAVSYLGSDSDQRTWAQFDHYHRRALLNLEASGAQVALIASNTCHHRFDDIVRGIQIPVVSILRETAKEIERIGAQQVLLLGTDLTMRSQRFREEFAIHGAKAGGPSDGAIWKMTTELIADLQLSQCAGAVERLLRIVKLCFPVEFEQRPAVCLACTELPLVFETMRALRTFEYGGFVFVNTTAIHVDAIFHAATAKERRD